MKKLLIIFTVSLSINSFAQTDTTVAQLSQTVLELEQQVTSLESKVGDLEQSIVLLESANETNAEYFNAIFVSRDEFDRILKKIKKK